MNIVEKLEMIKDLWDMGVTQNIEQFVKKYNEKHKDMPDMDIEYTIDEDGRMVLSDLQRLFIAREIAEDILNNSL